LNFKEVKRKFFLARQACTGARFHTHTQHAAAPDIIAVNNTVKSPSPPLPRTTNNKGKYLSKHKQHKSNIKQLRSISLLLLLLLLFVWRAEV